MLASSSMEVPPRKTPLFTRRAAILAVAALGLVVANFSFRDSRAREHERAEAEFIRRSTIQHTLTREVLGRYEDGLFGLNALFALNANISRTEFTRAARRIEARTPGAQSYEWVPFVTAEGRADIEAAFQRAFSRGNYEIFDYAGGKHVRAPDREDYLPITYVYPISGNEAAIGYDLSNAPSRPFLDRARQSRTLTLSRQIRLVQEKVPNQMGVILIAPVWRPPKSASSAEPDAFVGFVQVVFRTRDLLERAHAASPDAGLDMLFVDGSETDPALRTLYYRPADDKTPRSPAPTEAGFRAGGVSHELALPVGGRDWHVLYRPRAGWIEEQYTPLAWVRVAGILAITTLLGGLVHALGRRTEIVENVVTERTAQLAESRRELDSLLHALPGMAYRCKYDDDLTVVFVSDGALALTGRPAADFIAGRIHFRDIIHPDDLARVRATTQTALDERRDFEVEYRVRHPDGNEHWVLSRGAGIYDSEGKLQAFEGLAIGITAQKDAEGERIALERKLLEGQKLESLGLLAGGIAHDFNNLLTGILGNASLSRLILPAGSPIDGHLRAIETASLRAAELCRQMLAYAGKGRFVVEPIDLGALTSGLVPLLEVSIARKAVLRLALAPSLPAVLADATQLRQIVMNLVLNAADATGDRGGEIVVATGVMHADHATLNASVTGAGLAEGDYVFLEVQDNGCGMTAEVIAKIFDPFYTTKFAGRGLGLAAVLGIVRGHHGALQVVSEPDHGSTFRLLLPSASAGTSASRSPLPLGAPEPAKLSGKVLVIDDEEPVRTIAAQMLGTLGLTPTTADDGREGLALIRANPTAYEFVVLDLMMPGLSGEETLAALRILRPDLPVLIISGYNEGDLLRRLASPESPLVFLPKPFTRSLLAEKIRELLG